MTPATERPLTAMIDPAAGPPDCAAYESAGGWQGVRRALGSLAPAEVIDMVTRSKLRGRGLRDRAEMELRAKGARIRTPQIPDCQCR